MTIMLKPIGAGMTRPIPGRDVVAPTAAIAATSIASLHSPTRESLPALLEVPFYQDRIVEPCPPPPPTPRSLKTRSPDIISIVRRTYWSPVVQTHLHYPLHLVSLASNSPIHIEQAIIVSFEHPLSWILLIIS